MAALPGPAPVTRRRIARAYDVPPFRIVTYSSSPGLWHIRKPNGRAWSPEPFPSLAAAIAAIHRGRPPPRTTPTDAPERPEDSPPAVPYVRHLATPRRPPTALVARAVDPPAE